MNKRSQTTTQKRFYRQGDVLIERIAKVPTSAKKATPIGGRIVLALGEATGHHHSINADAADWWKDGEEQFVTVRDPVEVKHQEHKPVPLKRGHYRIVRQREYSPAQIRRVTD